MRRARTVSLIVVLFFFASTDTVFAECAWVLWEHTFEEPTGWRAWTSSGVNKWTPTGAVPTRAECEKGQATFEKQSFVLRKALTATNRDAANSDNHTQWICLPDTVDPRGPKVK
jgi:hypothetical protein